MDHIFQEIGEKLGLADRKANALQGELEEARSLLDSADRGKKQAEIELSDARAAVNEMTAINTKANADKRHLESAVHTMHAEIDDMLHQAKNSEEKAKKAMVDAARLADELRSEQDHASSQEKAKRALEAQIAELDQRLAEVKHMICHNKTMNTYLGHYVNTKLSHLILQATKTFVLEHSLEII